MPPTPYHQGPPTDHFDGTRFHNPNHPGTDKTLSQLLRWKFASTSHPWTDPDNPDNRIRPAAQVRPAPRVDHLAVTMVGHASLLIQTATLNILLDPVWSHRASPLRFAGPRRHDPPGIAWPDLPPIHAILLSHSHYDHMDAPTLARLHQAFAPRIIAPLGNDAVLAPILPGARIETADWHGRIPLSPQVAVTIHPAYHWSARRPNDRRLALWSGFVLETPAGPVYLAADTAYGDGAPFRSVRDRFGPPTLAVLPIGAYEPRWFMQDQHANPEEAVRMLEDCAAAQALGVHWGTFQLTGEARNAPAAALAQACARRNIPPTRFLPLRPGDVWTPPSLPRND